MTSLEAFCAQLGISPDASLDDLLRASAAKRAEILADQSLSPTQVDNLIRLLDDLQDAIYEEVDRAQKDAAAIEDEGGDRDAIAVFSPPEDPYAVERSPVEWLRFQALSVKAALSWRLSKPWLMSGLVWPSLTVGTVALLFTGVLPGLVAGGVMGFHQLRKIRDRQPSVGREGWVLVAGGAAAGYTLGVLLIPAIMAASFILWGRLLLAAAFRFLGGRGVLSAGRLRTGDVVLADVAYLDGGRDDEGRTHKERPAIVIRDRIYGPRLLPLTSQKKREGQDGFVTVVRVDGDGDESKSFANMYDLRAPGPTAVIRHKLASKVVSPEIDDLVSQLRDTYSTFSFVE